MNTISTSDKSNPLSSQVYVTTSASIPRHISRLRIHSILPLSPYKFNKPVILSLSKNPAGLNQAIATVNTDKRKKDVIIAINDKANDGRDVSWLWDVDFDKIADENLNTLTTTGIRVYDISLRFKYSDIKVDRMTQDMADAITKCLETDSEVVYVLVNYTALYSTEAVLKKLGGEA